MQTTPLYACVGVHNAPKSCRPTAASVAVLLEHMQGWLLFPVPCIHAEEGAILWKDSVRGAEGVRSQLAFVCTDILLGAWAVWEGTSTEVTGWVLPAGIKLTQTTGNKKQMLWIKHYRSRPEQNLLYVGKTLCRILQLLPILFSVNTDILGSFAITLALFPAEFWELKTEPGYNSVSSYRLS